MSRFIPHLFNSNAELNFVDDIGLVRKNPQISICYISKKKESD